MNWPNVSRHIALGIAFRTPESWRSGRRNPESELRGPPLRHEWRHPLPRLPCGPFSSASPPRRSTGPSNSSKRQEKTKRGMARGQFRRVWWRSTISSVKLWGRMLNRFVSPNFLLVCSISDFYDSALMIIGLDGPSIMPRHIFNWTAMIGSSFLNNFYLLIEGYYDYANPHWNGASSLSGDSSGLEPNYRNIIRSLSFPEPVPGILCVAIHNHLWSILIHEWNLLLREKFHPNSEIVITKKNQAVGN